MTSQFEPKRSHHPSFSSTGTNYEYITSRERHADTGKHKQTGYICKLSPDRNCSSCPGITKRTPSRKSLLFNPKMKWIIPEGLTHIQYDKYSMHLFICLLALCLQGVESNYYPDTFNAALGAPITLNPESAICGYGSILGVSYCRSYTDPASVTSCWESTCNLACPHRSSLPVDLEMLEVIESGWGDCVSDRSSEGHDGVEGRAVYFSGSGNDPCYLTVSSSWMSPLALQDLWTITITMWIKPQITGRPSTLLAIANSDTSNTVIRVLLNATSHVTIDTGTQQFSRDDWHVNKDQWHFLAAQIHGDSLAVFLNGTLMGSALFGINFRPPNQAGMYRVGQSFSDGDPYIGYIQDLKIFTECLTNREVVEVYNGNLPSILVQSECRCPSAQPRLKPGAELYCVANEGAGRPTEEEYRLNRNAFVPEFMVDGKADTHWISSLQETEVSFTIDLEDLYEVLSVTLTFYSPFSSTVRILRLDDVSEEWQLWQYFAVDCVTAFSLQPDAQLTSETDVNCISLAPEGGEIAYTNGVAELDLLAGRPGQTGLLMTDALRQFLRARKVRVVLSGFQDIVSGNPRNQYHALHEVAVNARCDCHGHGSSCDVSHVPYQCTCSPDTYSQGRQCDVCIDGSFFDVTRDTYVTDYCQMCDCDQRGVTEGDLTCNEENGQCSCKTFASGRRCDSCMAGYHTLSSSNPDGCSACTCNTAGTVGAANVCDVNTAQCVCKTHVTGLSCDTCEAGYFNMDAANSGGCTPCQCNTAGTQDGATTCDQQTGQCQCKDFVTGQTCDQCMTGYHGLNPSNPLGCSVCGCDPLGSHNNSCNPLTGACFCMANVIGIACTECKEDFFAIDENDFQQNGCTHPCDCHPEGTMGEGEGGCEMYTGQCQCKENVVGRTCNECGPNMFGFDLSPQQGCLPCDCHVNGTRDPADSCDSTTGQCVCKSKVTGRDCSSCLADTWGLSGDNPEGCTPCECYVPATQGNGYCDVITGRCPCIEGAGDPSVTNHTCMPYVMSISPLYGPEAGGTMVTVKGGFLQGVASSGSIAIDNYSCAVDTIYSNQTHVYCETSPATSSVIDQELPVVANVPDVGDMAMPDPFVYRLDPVIDDVFPLQTIQSGGIVLTVKGLHFDSVFRPILDIFLPLANALHTFSSDCIVEDPETLKCPTPSVSLPDSGGSFFRRRRRNVMNPWSPEHLGLRSRRDATEVPELFAEGTDELDLFFGFRLDGVDMYQNMTGVLPRIGPLTVYANPQFERFDEENALKIRRPYWPYLDEELIIKGKRLNLATGLKDYTIQIGTETCEMLDLSTNRIHCMPPEEQPQPGDTGHFQGAPTVSVFVGNIVETVGYLQYEPTFWDNPPFRYGIIGSIVAFLLLILLIITCCCARRSHRQQPTAKHPYLEMEINKHTNNYISAYSSAASTGSNATYMNPESDLLLLLPSELRYKLTDCLLDVKRMELGKMIGQGHFGRVHLGRLYDETRLNSTAVAIKTLREYHVTPRDVIDFLEEATIMKDFKHEHVLHLVGVVIDDFNRCYVLLPYMQNGDLRTFVSSEDNMLTVGELINFAYQVADGMDYLASQKFVHRDLACRNCMVDKDLVVRVADFGLSRDIFERDYYRDGEERRPLPVKWMSQESLEHGIYTTKSDVWSYGVLLWELMTRGCTPYPDVDSYDLKNYIQCGKRMDKPDFSPPDMYQIMLESWDSNPDNRPSFTDIKIRISKLVNPQTTTTLWREHQQRYVRPRSYHLHEMPLDLIPGHHNLAYTLHAGEPY